MKIHRFRFVSIAKDKNENTHDDIIDLKQNEIDTILRWKTAIVSSN